MADPGEGYAAGHKADGFGNHDPAVQGELQHEQEHRGAAAVV